MISVKTKTIEASGLYVEVWITEICKFIQEQRARLCCESVKYACEDFHSRGKCQFYALQLWINIDFLFRMWNLMTRQHCEFSIGLNEFIQEYRANQMTKLVNPCILFTGTRIIMWLTSSLTYQCFWRKRKTSVDWCWSCDQRINFCFLSWHSMHLGLRAEAENSHLSIWLSSWWTSLGDIVQIKQGTNFEDGFTCDSWHPLGADTIAWIFRLHMWNSIKISHSNCEANLRSCFH